MTGHVRATIRVTGLVQGVFYRASTRDRARALDLTGWVRNERDGSVSAVVEGPKDSVEQLVRWCHDGPPAARVDAIDVKWQDATGEHNEFHVTG